MRADGKIGAVIRVASGNFLEMYDFMVYGYYAVYIAKTFFPASNEFASLMLSLMTFGVGYLMRPVGAIVLGAYIDRVGRRQGLIVTLALMAVGTLTVAVTPGYAAIGLAAPVIVVIGRLLQGFSAGVELGGVSVYLAEIAPPARRGFYVSWQSASQQVAVVFAALLGLMLAGSITADQMASFGWRIPLIIGCLIVPAILWLRQSLEETPAFEAMQRTRGSQGAQRVERTSAVIRTLASHWPLVIVGMMLTVFTTTSFYLITAYTPTFGRQALHLAPVSTFAVTLCVGLANFMWLPVGGAVSDRVGRHPVLFSITVLALLTAYPAMSWLVAAPSFQRLLAVELWFSFFFGMYNGAMVALLVELMPSNVRTAGFSLAYSLATALFGGFTPAICTYLIERTGNKAAPALWLSLGAAVGLAGALLSVRRREVAGLAVATSSIATATASPAKS